ncbi:SHOCT domain-containing protein [Brachybacterium saurashtrense]
MDSGARLDELERLGALQAQGVLSPSEFAAEKARILGS